MIAFFLLAAVAASASAETFPLLCYSPNLYNAAAEKCYSDQGLKLHTPQDPNNPDHITDANIKNALTATPEAVCNNTAAYDKAINCSLSLSDSCTPQAFKALLPSLDNLKQMQNLMCANLASIEHLCTLNNTNDLQACGQQKYGQLTVSDAQDPYKATCASYQHAEECLEQEIQECGKANLDLQKQFNQLQKPVACQSTTAAPGR